MSVGAQPLWATSLLMSRCGACPCMSVQVPASERTCRCRQLLPFLGTPGQRVARCMALSGVQGLLATKDAVVYRICCSA